MSQQETSNLKKVFFFGLLTLGFFLPLHVSHALTFSPQRFELEADPGQIIEREMTLTNEGTDPQTFYSVFRNFEAEGETGVPTPTDSTTGLASWLKAQKQITLAPKSTETVAYQIYVPKDATPGGYFSMILWSTTAPNVAPGQVAIGAQTGPLVLLTVNGDIKEAGAVSGFKVRDGQQFFLSLPVDFVYKFRNDGGDRVKPQGTVKIKNILGLGGKEIAANIVEGNVLPSGTRLFQTEWKRNNPHAATLAKATDKANLGFFGHVKNEWYNYAFGRYRALLSINYGTKGGHAEAVAVFWVVPWHLLLTIIVILTLVYFLFKGFIRRYNRFIIGQATLALEKMEEKKKEDQEEREEKTPSRHQEERSDTETDTAGDVVDLRKKKHHPKV